ncbi:MAG: MFS transporter [Pseudomonadota bacterium]
MGQTLLKVVLILALWAAGLLAGGQFAKVSVILPELQAIYPERADRVAWLLTLLSIVGAVFGGLSARIANRIGLQRCLIAAMLTAGALSLWQATYPDFAVMALSRVAEGVTHLGIVVTAPALMAEISAPRWRGATMALWSTFFGVSFALVAWFGLPLMDALRVSGLFQLHGVGLIVMAGVIYGLLRCLGGAGLGRAAEESESPSGPVPLATSSVLWPGIGWLFYTLTFLALLTILPLQLPDGLRAEVTTVMSLVGIGVSLIVLPVALMKVRATTVVLTGFLLAALLTALGASQDMLALSVTLFAILGLVQGGTFAAVAELNRSTESRTLGYGVMAQTGNIGNLIGTPLLLMVLGSAGLETLLITTAGIYLLGFLSLFILMRRLHQSAP